MTSKLTRRPSRPGRRVGKISRLLPVSLCTASVLLAPVGCGPRQGDDAPPAQQAAAFDVPDVGAQWSREALELQPRMERLVRATPPEPGYAPGTTPWRSSERMAATGPDSLAAGTPGSALSKLATSLGLPAALGDAAWEQTTRVWLLGEDEAVGVVLLWGFLDDAVAGQDLRVQLRLTGGSWKVEAIEVRFHCRRRVTEDGLCA